jgi:hypothetical protein|nr:MAG TPA: Head decoration protein [Caudoviricetes sp.]
MVKTSGVVIHEVDDSWRYGEKNSNDSVSVVIVPELFKTTDNKYLTGVGPKATTVYIRGGIPLAKITSGTNKGMYGPYDKTATDGRQTAIAGLLESEVAVNITLAGWDAGDPLVGMTYRGDIVKSKLPVVPEEGAVWNCDLYDVENDSVTRLAGGASGSSASYVLPAATSNALGGVKKVATPSEDSVAALKTALKSAGIFA